MREVRPQQRFDGNERRRIAGTQRSLDVTAYGDKFLEVVTCVSLGHTTSDDAVPVWILQFACGHAEQVAQTR